MPNVMTATTKAKRTKPEEAPIDLAKIVAECVVEAKYANAPATDLLIARGHADSRVYNEICRLGFELLCTEMVGKYIRNYSAAMRAQAAREKAERDAAEAKRATATGATPRAAPRPKMDASTPAHRAAVRSIANHVSAAAIMPIQGYGRLCDMTFAEVREAANAQDKQATTMAIRVRYLRAVYAARGLNGDHTRTGSVLADTDFTRLHDQEVPHVAA